VRLDHLLSGNKALKFGRPHLSAVVDDRVPGIFGSVAQLVRAPS